MMHERARKPANVSTPSEGIGRALLRRPRRLATIDHRERLWDRAGKIAADPFQILYQKNYALCGNCHNLEFGLIQPLGALLALDRDDRWFDLRNVHQCSRAWACPKQRAIATAHRAVRSSAGGPDGSIRARS
jgi:hypothetical protein